MNLSRAALTSLRSRHRHRLLRPPLAAALLFSTKTSPPKRPSSKKQPLNPPSTPPPPPPPLPQQQLPDPPILNLKRPAEIPFQPRVANAVHLIGTIGVPVQKQTLPDGRLTAVSVLIQEKYLGLPKVWIPVIFQGELAEVAATFLKENDTVHITGQLNGDNEPVKVDQSQANVQVLAHTLNYVVDSGPNSFKDARDAGAELEAPVAAEKKASASYTKGGTKKPNMMLWDDIVANPQNWVDNRMDKQNGLVKVNFPDFKNKVTKEALWIDSAPSLILEHLDQLEFANNPGSRGQSFSSRGAQSFSNSSYSKSSQPYLRKNGETGSVSKDALWKDLVDNPKNWWDNRSSKLKPNQPDFKHKDNGEALWIGKTTPQWALAQLPPENAKGGNSGAYGDKSDVWAKSSRTTLLS